MEINRNENKNGDSSPKGIQPLVCKEMLRH